MHFYICPVQQNFQIKVSWKRRLLTFDVTVTWRTQSLIRFKVEYPGRGYYELNYLAAQKRNNWKIANHTFHTKNTEKMALLTSMVFRELEFAMKPPIMPHIDPKNAGSTESKRKLAEYEKKKEEWNNNDFWTQK